MTNQDDVRQQLDDVEKELRFLRGESDGLRDQVGGRGDGPQDPEDTAAAMNNAEENAAVIATLEQRRDTLRAELGENTD